MTRRHLVFLALLLAPAAARAGSSNSLLDVHPDGKKLLCVNADNGTVTLIDLVKREAVREIVLGDKPEGVAWLAGDVAAATVFRDDVVVLFDAASGKVLDKVKVSDEPYGIVATKDGSRAYVTLEYPGKVAEIDVKTRRVLREIDAGSHVRGIALSPDEKTVYVTEFYTGVLNAIDLASGKVVDSWRGHTTDNIARHVVLHPTRLKAFIAHIRSKILVNHGDGSIFPQLSICDLVSADKKADRRASIGLDTYNGVAVMCNPWETAISPDGKRLYTIYAGTDDLNVHNVIDDDYKEVTRAGYLRRLGKNPRAVRVSPDGKEVYVSNALDFTVTIHDATFSRTLATVKACDPPKSPEWVLGKVLFNSAKYPMTRRQWIACSSCHPDGHHDGRVWKNPEGFRRTPPMFGMAHTHPLHWSGDRDEVQDFEYTIRGALMGGIGLAKATMLKGKAGFNPIELDMVTSGRTKELDALAIYNNSFDFTLSPHAAAPGKLTPQAARGKGVFFDKDVGCAKCHDGPYYSDSRLKKPFNLHDVGTGGGEDERMGPKYDTPTLLGVYRSAPYLHNGKAKTLLEVVTTQNQGDKHGKTSHLRREQLDDLVSFLRSLPYEVPPGETENTVKHRFVPRKKD